MNTAARENCFGDTRVDKMINTERKNKGNPRRLETKTGCAQKKNSSQRRHLIRGTNDMLSPPGCPKSIARNRNGLNRVE